MDPKLNEKPAYTLTVVELRQLINEEVSRALSERSMKENTSAMEDELLSISTLALHLGVSKQTVHNHRFNGLLPLPSYIGTRPRWSRNEVDKFLQGHKKHSPKQLI